MAVGRSDRRERGDHPDRDVRERTVRDRDGSSRGWPLTVVQGSCPRSDGAAVEPDRPRDRTVARSIRRTVAEIVAKP
jgi:hypothetical protein